MTVFNLGSINIDHVYRVPHLPHAGETLAASDYAQTLGGKGANQSVAALRAGARLVHIGAIGAADGWTAAQLSALGIDLGTIARVEGPTGHAIIAVDPAGENSILIHPGANRLQDEDAIEAALSGAQAGDILLLQNETSHQVAAAKRAHEKHLRVFYSAAPFEMEALQAVMPHVTHLLVNAVEAAELCQAMDTRLEDLPLEGVVVTKGAEGAEWIAAGAAPIKVPAVAVEAVDTTGAGDCFAGSLVAALDDGMSPEQALRYAAAAAAIQVTREGTSTAMPDRGEVEALLATQGDPSG
ncbi:ribokinase [Pararhodobacter sp. SW119]|uniref:ribokinase n=1 Tax=Pararhodobacter sp. SW119 TaxID=2780075 RepID=UPI001AE0C1E1|nr:ribokinase [Pararhodobacter sp. SW119]